MSFPVFSSQAEAGAALPDRGHLPLFSFGNADIEGNFFFLFSFPSLLCTKPGRWEIFPFPNTCKDPISFLRRVKPTDFPPKKKGPGPSGQNAFRSRNSTLEGLLPSPGG